MFIRIAYRGEEGYGEASMPPYLGESHETADAFFRLVDLSRFPGPGDIRSVMEYIDGLAPGNTSAKAAIDIALHDLAGKIQDKPVYELFGADPFLAPCTSFTIGMDDPDKIRGKVKEATDFPILKVKLGGEDDLRILQAVRASTAKPFSVDVNQGWADREFALDMICRMKEMNVVFVEQPFRVDNLEDQLWLKERSPLPVIADESCRRFSDIESCRDAFHGINIKLMKCTGLSEGRRMIEEAGKHNLKVLIGCMSESSCGVSAAATLTPFASWADMDGPLLITNDAFDGISFDKGRIIFPERPGIGAVPKVLLFGGE